MDQQLIEQVDQLLAPYFDTLGKRIQGMKTVVNVPEPRVNVTVPDIKIPKIVVPKIELPTINVPTPRVVVPKPEVTVNVDKVKIENWPEFPTTERFDDTEILKSLQKLIQKPAGGGGGAHSTTFLNTSGKYVDVSATNPLPVDITDTSLTTAQGTAAANSGAWPMRLINTDDTDNSVLLSGSYMQKVGVYADGDKYVRGIVAEGASLSQVEPVFGGFKDASGNSRGFTGKVLDSRNGLDVQASSMATKTFINETTYNTPAAGHFPLGSSEVFDSGWIDTDGYGGIILTAIDNSSGGTALKMEEHWSEDGTTDVYQGSATIYLVGGLASFGYAGLSGAKRTIQMRYVRYIVTNDTIAQPAGGTPAASNFIMFTGKLIPVPFPYDANIINTSGIPVIGVVDVTTGAGTPVIGGGVDSVSSPTTLSPFLVDSTGVLAVKGTATVFTGTPLVVAEKLGATGTESAVTASTTSGTLLAASTTRRAIRVVNTSATIPAYYRCSSSACTTASGGYTGIILPGESVDIVSPSFPYSGAITCITPSSTASLSVTQIT